MPVSPLDDLRVEDWEDMIDINIKGVLYGIAAALLSRLVHRCGEGGELAPGCAGSRRRRLRIKADGLRNF